jgi:macrodomain Ter protein organizer (MatP/YcbG family)
MLPGDFTVSEGHGHPLVWLKWLLVRLVQYLRVGHKNWFNVQYIHLKLSFIDINGSNMIKMVVSSFSAYFVYHTLEDNIVYLIGR